MKMTVMDFSTYHPMALDSKVKQQ